MPLSDRALTIFDGLPREKDNPHIFSERATARG